MPRRLTCTLYAIVLTVACALTTLEVQAAGIFVKYPKGMKHPTTQNANASGEADAQASVMNVSLLGMMTSLFEAVNSKLWC